MWRTALLPVLRDRRVAAQAAKKALLLALLLHLFGLVSVPEYKVRIRVVEPKQLEVLELPPETNIPTKPKPFIEPVIAPEEADPSEDVPEDRTIAETVLDARIAALTPVEPVQNLPEFGKFVAYDTKPDFIRYVTPEYPQMAVTAGIQGTVSAHLLVGVDGKVLDVRIMSGPEIFHESVRAAAMASLLSPAKQRDKPVAVWIALPYHFTLRDAR